MIKQRSRLTAGISWDRAVGVGYTTISWPVGPYKLEAVHPLYIVLAPQGSGTQLDLVPVGQLEDLDRWLSERRQSSLTILALLLLSVGFLLQLWITVQF